MNKTSIEWTDLSCNPLKYRTADGRVVWGCAKVSGGCTHCYSETLAERFAKGGPYNAGVMAGLTPFLDEKELHRMLTYKPAAGKRCFVGDMTDVFGEWMPDELLDRLFAVFALRSDVTWQILTKRPERMRRWFDATRNGCSRWAFVAKAAHEIAGGNSVGTWPLPNVWLGCSVENQQTADERIPYLLQTPAAVRFISAEPLLAPVIMRRRWLGIGADCDECRVRDVQTDEDGCCQSCGHDALWHGIDLVIVGGESGPRARPCDVAWIRSIVKQCAAADVACFVKQLGSRPMAFADPLPEPQSTESIVRHGEYDPDPFEFELRDRKGGDPAEWSEDLRVREMPRVEVQP